MSMPDLSLQVDFIKWFCGLQDVSSQPLTENSEPNYTIAYTKESSRRGYIKPDHVTPCHGSRPSHLLVMVELPGVRSANLINLQVSERGLLVESVNHSKLEVRVSCILISSSMCT